MVNKEGSKKIFLAPVSISSIEGTPKNENWERLKNGHKYLDIDPASRALIPTSLSTKNNVYFWGARTPGTWKKMDKGDLVLFYTGKGSFTLGAPLLHKMESDKFAEKMLKNAKEDIWKFIYFLEKPVELHLPITVITDISLRGLHKYKLTSVRGLMPVHKTVRDNILKKYGNFEQFLTAHRPGKVTH